MKQLKQASDSFSRIFDVLPNFLFTTRETICDYYL